MYYIIKHGFKKPTTKDLAEYQLGWSIDDGALYINDPENDEPIQRVVSDKALETVLTAVGDDIEKAAKDYYNQHMTSTAKILRNTYERNVIYSITYNEPSGETHDANDTTNFNFYKATTKDDAVLAFISAWTDVKTLDTTIDLEGTKVVVTDNKTQNVYFYIIIKNEKDTLVGKYLTTLESSLPNMSISYNAGTNKISFYSDKELLNELSMDGLILRGGEWGDSTKLEDSSEESVDTSDTEDTDTTEEELGTYTIIYGWDDSIMPSNLNRDLYSVDSTNGTVAYIGDAFTVDEGDYRYEDGIPKNSYYITTDGDIEICSNSTGTLEGYLKEIKVKVTEEASTETTENTDGSTEETTEETSENSEVDTDENSN